MVTQTKQQQATAKKTPPPLHKLDGKLHKAHADVNLNGRNMAEDASFTEQVDRSSRGHKASAGKAVRSSLVGRGKDLISGETGSVVTAAAIVVGAALIEVELIPGLIIGAGAILLGKFFPEFGSYVRPAIKGAVRAGFSMSQKAREAIAEASEQVHDLVAEVKHEQEQPKSEKKSRVAKKVAAAGDELPVH